MTKSRSCIQSDNRFDDGPILILINWNKRVKQWLSGLALGIIHKMTPKNRIVEDKNRIKGGKGGSKMIQKNRTSFMYDPLGH